jgi:hypothetical protein
MSQISENVREKGLLFAAWQKYGLIVVGNIVFFALLYFIQYRPNSLDQRAVELVTLAQREEAEQRLEAAETLYRTVISEYPEARAAKLATERLPKVLGLAKRKRETQPKLPAACTPSIDIKELLEVRPSLYVAELLAGHYPEVQPAERDRYFSVLDGYVWAALNRDRVPLDKMRKSMTFKAGELQQRYFGLKVAPRFAADWVYDDFKLKNEGYFALHNVVIEMTAKQGSESEQASVRVPELAAGAEIDVLEFDVSEARGAVEVAGTITADEGKLAFAKRL